MDFSQLVGVPFQYIVAGIALFYIKLDKDREKYWRDVIEKKDKQIEQNQKSFLSALTDLTTNQRETKEDIKELKEDVKRISGKIK